MVLSLSVDASECADLSEGDASSNNPMIKRQGQVKDQIELLRPQFDLCKRNVNGLYSGKSFMRNSSGFDTVFMKIRVRQDGQLVGLCDVNDCERNVFSSLDLEEAKYKMELAKCYREVLSKVKISRSSTTIPPLCWLGPSRPAPPPSSPSKSRGTR